MAINFPVGPSIGDSFTVGGITWTWDGTTWAVSGGTGGGGGGITSETDPVYSASAAASIGIQDIANWNTAYSNYVTKATFSVTNAASSNTPSRM